MARTKTLDTGDSIEFQMTVYVNPKKGTEAWLKMGASSTVRESETAGKAFDRVQKFVEKRMGDEVDEWYDN